MENTNTIEKASYLTFQLSDETFALSVKYVINILEMCKITQVPRMPDYLKGVINLRGEVLPVIDMRMKFGLPPIEITKNTCILVLEISLDELQTKIGVLVDSVSEVIERGYETIKPPPTIGAKYKSEFITGMLEELEKFTMILDINKVFSTNEIINIQEINTNIKN